MTIGFYRFVYDSVERNMSYKDFNQISIPERTAVSGICFCGESDCRLQGNIA